MGTQISGSLMGDRVGIQHLQNIDVYMRGMPWSQRFYRFRSLYRQNYDGNLSLLCNLQNSVMKGQKF